MKRVVVKFDFKSAMILTSKYSQSSKCFRLNCSRIGTRGSSSCEIFLTRSTKKQTPFWKHISQFPGSGIRSMSTASGWTPPLKKIWQKEMIEFLHWFCRLSFRNYRKRARSGVLRVVNWSVCLRVGGIAAVVADHARRMRLERVTAVLGHLRRAKRRWVGGAGRSDSFEVILGAGRLAFDKRLIEALKNNHIPTKKWIMSKLKGARRIFLVFLSVSWSCLYWRPFLCESLFSTSLFRFLFEDECVRCTRIGPKELESTEFWRESVEECWCCLRFWSKNEGGKDP